jgi:hypothetical protein
LHIAMIRAGPWEASGAGSGNSGSGRPVGPTCPAVRILNAASESNSLSRVPVLLTVSLALIGETLSAGTGVALGIHLTQPLDRDEGVDLRRRHRGVAEQLLHDAHVGAALEQVRRERVAQRVR